MVVADDALARGGLAALIAAEPGLEVVAQTAPQTSWNLPIGEVAPIVAAWDIGADAPAGLGRLRLAASLPLPVVALVPGEAAAAEALRVGATGLLPRETSGRPLGAALHAVAAGLVALDPDLSRALLTPRRGVATVDTLTPREGEVLQLLAEGLPNKAIAERLGMSDHTAKFHVNAILDKLGAETRTEAVVLGLRAGLVSL
jgi:DNA-binding NarL/FixJ family response regulator